MSTVQSTPVLDKLRSRGYWGVVIRPATFDESRIPYGDLFSTIDKNSVGFRGWDYPHVDHQTKPRRGQDWIGQEFDRDDVIEIWRFHTSGLFVHNFAMTGEWRDQSLFWPADPDWQPNCVYYINTIYSFLEIFEFAARLAQSQVGESQMRVEIALKNLQGRQLVSEGRHFRPSDNFTIEIPEWAERWDMAQTELIARPRELAARAARDFLARFGLDISLEVLAQIQGTIGR